MIGKYVLGRYWLFNRYFDWTLRDSSPENFYYFVEEVAKASEAWDIVEYARADTSDLWCMLVSKNKDKLGYYTAIEFYDYDYNYIGVSHYIYITESLRSSIFTEASNRSELINLGFIRNDASGQIKDLGVINASDMNLSTVIEKISLDTAYIGPDVVIVGDYTKDYYDNNNLTINLMFFERSYFPGNLICLKSAQTFPVLGDSKWIGVGSSGISSSIATELIPIATHNVSSDYRHQEYIPFYYYPEISPKLDDYDWFTAYFTPLIAFYNGATYEIFEYTWKIYSNAYHETILNGNYYELIYDVLRYYYTGYPPNFSLYSKVDLLLDYEEEFGGNGESEGEIPR